MINGFILKYFYIYLESVTFYDYIFHSMTSISNWNRNEHIQHLFLDEEPKRSEPQSSVCESFDFVGGIWYSGFSDRHRTVWVASCFWLVHWKPIQNIFSKRVSLETQILIIIIHFTIYYCRLKRNYPNQNSQFMILTCIELDLLMLEGLAQQQ